MFSAPQTVRGGTHDQDRNGLDSALRAPPVTLLAARACVSRPDQSVETRKSAIELSGISLDLQESGNSCWGNGSQTYFQVKNNDRRRSSSATSRSSTGSMTRPEARWSRMSGMAAASRTPVGPASIRSPTCRPRPRQFTACGAGRPAPGQLGDHRQHHGRDHDRHRASPGRTFRRASTWRALRRSAPARALGTAHAGPASPSTPTRTTPSM